MKKIAFIFLILAFILGMSGYGYAQTQWSCDDSGCNTSGLSSVGDIASFQTSKNVEIQVSSASQSYAAIADHLNGDRAFGASSDSTKIYYTSKNKGDHYSDTNTPDASDSSAFSGWSSL